MGFNPNPPVSVVCYSAVRLAGRYCVMMAKMPRLVQLSKDLMIVNTLQQLILWRVKVFIGPVKENLYHNKGRT